MLAHDFDVDKAVYETFNVTASKKGLEDTFSNYSPIYVAPTGNTKDAVSLYTKEENKVDNALVVGSQGSFAYELALNGVKEIDCFDINIVKYLYFALYNAAIKTISYKDFLSNFTSKKVPNFEVQNFTEILSDWMLFDVLDEMGGKEAEYWSKIYKTGKKLDLINSNLFRTYYPFFSSALKKLSSVYDRENYENLKSLLNHNEVEINYHICEIDELHKEFQKNKYDIIMFGNILQYYKQIPSLNNVGVINHYIKEKIVPMLKEGGKIQVGYGFEIAADATRELLNIGEIEKLNDISDFVMRYVIEKDKKEGFISNIIKKYGVDESSPYSIDFIRAAEEIDEHMKSKNVILTYQSKR